jgi:hypothetical protein
MSARNSVVFLVGSIISISSFGSVLFYMAELKSSSGSELSAALTLELLELSLLLIDP